MGWVSYLEDQIKRLDDSLHMAKVELDNPSHTHEQVRSSALAALAQAQFLRDIIWQNLNDATSPQMDVAHELRVQKERIHSLEIELQSARVAKLEAETEVMSLRSQLESKKNEFKLERAKRNRAEKDFENITKTAPGAGMATLLSKNRPRRKK